MIGGSLDNDYLFISTVYSTVRYTVYSIFMLCFQNDFKDICWQFLYAEKLALPAPQSKHMYVNIL